MGLLFIIYSVKSPQSMLDRRVTYKRRASYRTDGNKFKIVKTPGGRLSIQYIKKTSKTIKKDLHGMKSGRPCDLRRMSYRFRRVARPYGGVLTHSEVKLRIMRAFMTEELQNIKQKQQAAEKKSKKAKKAAKKTKKAWSCWELTP